MGVTRRSVKRAAASVRWLMTFEPHACDAGAFASQSARRVARPIVYIVQSNADDLHVGLIVVWTGEDTCRQDHRSDSERAGPRLRTPDGNSCSMHGGCFRASSAPRARSHRDESARGIRSMCENRRAKTSASRSIGRTSPPFAQVQPRRRLNNSHDDDANEWFVKHRRDEHPNE